MKRKNWLCPKCGEKYTKKELAKGQTCSNCDIPVKVIRI